MARRPKPWFRKGRGWFVTLDGKQIPLGDKKQEAFARFYELMNSPVERAVNSEQQLLSIMDEFLEWNRRNRAPATFQSYKEKLQSFINAAPKGLLATELKPIHIQRWLDANPQWANTTAHTHVTAMQRALNWATKMGIIDTNPIRGYEKPPKESRDEIITVEEYQSLLEAVPDIEFRDLLQTHWETGCRPQESLRVEARFVDLKHSRWVFPVKKSKGKKRPRICYLNEVALEITERRMKQYPQGPIFRNTHGNAWNKDSVGCRFLRLKKHLGRRYYLYLFRHSWAYHRLVGADDSQHRLDPLTVATLLGHQNPAMLATTYAHLTHNPEYLLAQLQAATSST